MNELTKDYIEFRINVLSSNLEKAKEDRAMALEQFNRHDENVNRLSSLIAALTEDLDKIKEKSNNNKE
jgi:hypothetical protein